MKLLLVISSLGLGGAERAVSILAREWVRHGHQVALATLEESGSIAAYDLPQELNRIYLGRGAAGLSSLRKLPRLLRIVRRIRRTVRAERPDIVVSFMDQTNVLTILGTLGLKVPCIVNEQIHPSFSSIEKFPALPLLSWFLIPLRNFSYRGARWITLLSERSRNCFPGYLQARIRVISNPVAELPAEARDAELPRPVVLGVGRLIPQKRFDRLIEAFALLAPQFPEWSLALAGEGRDRETLMRLADRLSVSSKVQFLGRRQAMGSLYKQADIFALSSDFEGFPNVLGEAMASGCAVIATDCLTGPGELIRHEVDGILTPVSTEGLAAGLGQLMQDEELRRRLGSNAKEVVERFGLTQVLALWDDLIKKVVN